MAPNMQYHDKGCTFHDDSWNYVNYTGVSTSTFDLIERNDKTTPISTAIGIENFPQEILEFLKDSYYWGWMLALINERRNEYINRQIMS